MSHRGPGAPDRLLDAALHEFAALGKGGARTQRVATLAGVNKQLIHYYFGTKEGLYEAALTHAAEGVSRQLAGLPLVGLTAMERLRRLVLGQFDFLLQHPRHTAMLIGATAGGEWADVAIRPIAELLREGQATGFFRDDVDPETHARLALVLTLGYFAVRPITSRWGEPLAWRERAAELVVRGASW
jgi:TetR/AcrR family transcriptional regulator